MKGYVLIPDRMLEDLDKLSKYLNESYDYVMYLEPKWGPVPLGEGFLFIQEDRPHDVDQAQSQWLDSLER